MRIGNYKINSSVIIAAGVAFMSSAADLMTNGVVVSAIAEMLMHFMGQPESFKPYLTDRIYQAALTFTPLLLIFLRVYNVRYRPPIEKIG